MKNKHTHTQNRNIFGPILWLYVNLLTDLRVCYTPGYRPGLELSSGFPGMYIKFKLSLKHRQYDGIYSLCDFKLAVKSTVTLQSLCLLVGTFYFSVWVNALWSLVYTCFDKAAIKIYVYRHAQLEIMWKIRFVAN